MAGFHLLMCSEGKATDHMDATWCLRLAHLLLVMEDQDLTKYLFITDLVNVTYSLPLNASVSWHVKTKWQTPRYSGSYKAHAVLYSTGNPWTKYFGVAKHY